MKDRSHYTFVEYISTELIRGIPHCPECCMKAYVNYCGNTTLP